MHYTCALLIIGIGLHSATANAIDTLAFASPSGDNIEQTRSQSGAYERPSQAIEANANALIQPSAAPTLTLENIITHMEASLAFYEALAEQNDWNPIARVKLISFGDQHPVVPQLRKKLIKLGDHPPVACGQLQDRLFDIELHEALMRFQSRHGGKVDGIFGPQTRRHINTSPRQRAMQLKVNIYRIKTFSPATDRFIQVNIPDYKLHLFEHNQPILTMKTIVGKKKRKTPVFDSQIDRIVVNPSWHVPKSIAYKDILPALKEDPNHLEKIGIDIVSGWGKAKQFIAPEQIDESKLYIGKNYQRFWQAPGKKNTLGSVKFLTNGPYSVYLHDTSAKRLFNEPNRAFSSGCIRLEQPRKLADALMRMTHGWERSQLDPIFDKDKTTEFRLADPIPLHVTYWTAWIDNQGLTHFRTDLYKRDRYELSQIK